MKRKEQEEDKWFCFLEKLSEINKNPHSETSRKAVETITSNENSFMKIEETERNHKNHNKDRSIEEKTLPETELKTAVISKVALSQESESVNKPNNLKGRKFVRHVISSDVESVKILKKAPSHLSNKTDTQSCASLKFKYPPHIGEDIHSTSNILAKGPTCSTTRSSVVKFNVSLSQFKVLNNRMLVVMENINSLIEQYVETTDDEDFLKKRNQALAFSSRLTGNHLYNLRKQVNEMEKLPIPNSSTNETQMTGLKQKLRSAYQCALSASQMCERYLQSGKLFLVTDKILELLKLILQLFSISKKKMMGSQLENIIPTSELKIESIVKLIEFRINSKEMMEAQTLFDQVRKNTRAVHPNVKSKRKVGDYPKLSMYAQNKPKKNLRHHLRNNSAFPAKSAINPSALIQNKLSSDCLNSSTTTKSNFFHPSDKEGHQRSLENERLSCSRSKIIDSSKQTKSVSCETVIPPLEKENFSSKCILSENLLQKPVTPKHEAYPPNIKLISIINTDDVEELPDEKQSENGTVDISQQEFESIIQYKNQYENFRSQSPLYNVDEYPWESLEQISETLCNDILVQVTSNLELDSIIRKIYDLEFR